MLVNNIVGGQFVDLSLLVQEASEEEPTCTLLAGQLVINPGPRKTKQLTDIISWVQAFSIYAAFFVPSILTELATFGCINCSLSA